MVLIRSVTTGGTSNTYCTPDGAVLGIEGADGAGQKCNRGAKFQTDIPHVTPAMYIILRLFLNRNLNGFSWLLLGDDKRTVDELTNQLGSYEREFKNREKDTANEQAALAVNDRKCKNTVPKHTVPNRKSSNYNYCYKKGHWAKSCPEWIADGKPAKPNQNDKFQRKDGVTANMSLLALH
ncbi:hypothetical protein AVEN_25346-1 [Araneus ventricosus]|uniref:CCHC-type domain-containing protein n=1 Tax=Araneus ventricosus TaxID=182803 RepID=A0A4Y2EF01_ARAVE|nr:hypothetical protein AVEN_25346-1 [Araneus ventricosus]